MRSNEAVLFSKTIKSNEKKTDFMLTLFQLDLTDFKTLNYKNTSKYTILMNPHKMKSETGIDNRYFYSLVVMVKLVPDPKRSLLFAFTQQEISGHKVQTKLHSQKEPFSNTQVFLKFLLVIATEKLGV